MVVLDMLALSFSNTVIFFITEFYILTIVLSWRCLFPSITPWFLRFPNFISWWFFFSTISWLFIPWKKVAPFKKKVAQKFFFQVERYCFIVKLSRTWSGISRELLAMLTKKEVVSLVTLAPSVSNTVIFVFPNLIFQLFCFGYVVSFLFQQPDLYIS